MTSPRAYRGEGPYVFACYAHDDSDVVYPEIAWLNAQGVNVWYDDGISPGHEWTEELASAIQACARVAFFVTPSSVASENCRRELNFAQEEGQDVVSIHLLPTEVPAGLRLSLNNRQAILKHQLPTEEFRSRMRRALAIDVAEPPPIPTRHDAKPARRTPAIATALALLIAIAGLFWWISRDQALVVETTTSAPMQKSIAVLPFENLSPDLDNAYFAAGIHEEILSQLTKIGDLSVIARTSVSQYADSEEPLSSIAEALKVGTIMEGSVRYAGNRVRISAQLIDPKTGVGIWSDVFEEDLKDIFGIQLAIATEIATALEAELSNSVRRRIGKQVTADPDAYGYYLLALSKQMNFAAMEPVNEALEKAIALDPEFATAMAFNAWVHAVQANVSRFRGAAYGPESTAFHMQKALRYAETAIALDEEQAYAHMVLGNHERALALKPNDYRVLSTIAAASRFSEKRYDEGIAMMERSIELNPADAANVQWLSEHLYRIERWPEAILQAQNVIRIAPGMSFGHAHLAKVASMAGQADLARASAETAESLDPDTYSIVDIVTAYGRIGDEAAARRLFERTYDEGKAAIADPFWQYRMHAAIGRTAEAMDFLILMVEQSFPLRGNVMFSQHAAHPLFDPVRTDPRFSDFAGKWRLRGQQAMRGSSAPDPR